MEKKIIWQCHNPECNAQYSEYVNGCSKCSSGEPGGSHKVSILDEFHPGYVKLYNPDLLKVMQEAESTKEDDLKRVKDEQLDFSIERGDLWKARAIAAENRIAELERWKAEAAILLNIIYGYADSHPECKIGMNKVQFVVERAAMYDGLCK